jgi:G6PDH family F420-dependent oxidoreductase
VLGDHWPPADIRLEMLAEAVDIMRELWRGDAVTRRGIHYTVENARIYTRPDEPIPVPVSGFGPKSIEIAAQIGDGFMTTSPDADGIAQYRELGGRGPSQAGVKVCWGHDEAACRRQAFETWRSSSVPGQLSQDLPMPSHFDQASELVTEDMVAEKMACGPDLERHLAAIRPYVEAGFDEVFISQVGGATPEFFDFFRKEIEPRL